MDGAGCDRAIRPAELPGDALLERRIREGIVDSLISFPKTQETQLKKVNFRWKLKDSCRAVDKIRFHKIFQFFINSYTPSSHRYFV